MSRRKKARYGREMRARAADLFEAGLGFELAAKKLDVPAPAVRKWLYAYRATGRKGLIGMGESRRTYDMETKLAVARAVVDEGMPRSEAMARFGIAAATSLDRWCSAGCTARAGRRRSSREPLSHALRSLRPSGSTMTSLAFMSRSLPAFRPVESLPAGKAEGACPAAPCALLPEAPRRGEGGQGLFAATPTNRSGAQICAGFRERP